ncbi:TRAP transporter small permease [Variovorax paradoxus]|uniref:TRAP transporter small permease protein n=1 Tax=Variovorax paradoxus TaxID=34073 RepID=A0A0H2LW80_VARPD|nr:TRAP transporter small permease [Variovorax paradoxus]KLN52792.1 TRAP transporter, DctQ subunit [Variovorax paradoxus]
MSSVAPQKAVAAPDARHAVDILEAAFGRLYEFMMLLACLLLLVIVGSITLDVLLRNVEITGLPRGFPASNDISEYALYFCTLLGAPWLLRAGQHIRVDIVLRAIPSKLAYGCEWLSDVMALAGCVVLAWMGVVMTFKSYASDAIQIKSIVIPEWWVMTPIPVVFALLAIEFTFRMRRLAHGPKEPRSDAVSAA